MADKGEATISIDKREYISACEKVFKEINLFEELPINLNPNYTEELNKIILEISLIGPNLGFYVQKDHLYFIVSLNYTRKL